jgi:DNA-binding transcriptional regulator YiaG
MDSTKIREIQEQHGLNNVEFAKLIGVSLSLVEKWRNGTRTVTKWMAVNIKVKLNGTNRTKSDNN